MQSLPRNRELKREGMRRIYFILTDQYVYPDDYPAEGEAITVFGTFDTYQQGEYTYAVLKDAKMVS